VIGALAIAAGAPILLDSFTRFANQGLGTPAPIRPPQRLVVAGLYRYVRNPMYVAVSLLNLGQGLLFGSVRLLEYGLVVWLGFFAFVFLYEEPALRRKFGKEYEQFCSHVARWIPRLKPFQPKLRTGDRSNSGGSLLALSHSFTRCKAGCVTRLPPSNRLESRSAAGEAGPVPVTKQTECKSPRRDWDGISDSCRTTRRRSSKMPRTELLSVHA
jgi:hypothetical protein